MKIRYGIVVLVSFLMGLGTAGVVQANDPVVSFEAGDTPGNHFTCLNTGNSKSIGCVPSAIGGAGQKSLAVIRPGETVGFSSFGGEASTIHTAVSLLWPQGAKHMPFNKMLETVHTVKLAPL